MHADKEIRFALRMSILDVTVMENAILAPQTLLAGLMMEMRMARRLGATITDGNTTKTQRPASAERVVDRVLCRYECAAMIDITQHVQLYRETARHIWNSCFASKADRSPVDGDFEAFDRICEQLFHALILSRNASSELASQLNVQGFLSIHVIPQVVQGTPILINRTDPSGPYWDDPMDRVKPDEIDLGFIGFFDWDSYGIIDMRYLRTRVLACPSNRVIEGRDALIEIGHAQIVLLPDSPPPLAAGR